MKINYAMSEKQVEILAAEYATASVETQRVGMTYLRVLVAACQAVLGKVKRGRVAHDTQMQVLNDVSGRYYAAVLRGITTPDLVADVTLEQPELTRRSRERNRRSTFARSSKSTLAAFITAGGDMRGLDVETVTRDPLLATVRAARGTTINAHKLERARNAILRVIAVEAKADPGGARSDLESIIEALQVSLDELTPNGNREAAHETTGVLSRTMVEPDPTMTQIMKGKLVHTRMKAPSGRAHA